MTAALLYALTSFAMVQASIWPEDMGGNLLGDDPNPTFPRQTSIFEDDSSDLLRQSGVNPIAVYPNMSMPGMPRGPKRRQLSGRLEARQEGGQCTQAGYVLVCPATEQDPCCAPGYPVCCHDPSSTCCPEGSFCTGTHTCCLNGAVGCGDSCCFAGVSCCGGVCCPSAAYTCNANNQCVTTLTSSSSSPPATTSFIAPTATDSVSNKNNVPIIAGASAGGVVLIAIIVFVAWLLLRKKPPAAPVSGNQGMSNVPTPYPVSAATKPALPTNMSGPPSNASYYPANGITNGNPPSSGPYSNSPTLSNQPSSLSGNPHRISTFVSPSAGPHSGSEYAATGGAGFAGLGANSSAVGPGGYVPPPPEVHISSSSMPVGTGGGVNYYANTPLPLMGPRTSVYTTSSANLTSNSPPLTSSSTAPLVVSNPGDDYNTGYSWNPMVGIVNNNGQGLPPWATSASPAPSNGSNPSNPSHSTRPTPSPGPLSPPPPFSPPPNTNFGANPGNNTQSWAIPPQHAQPPSNWTQSNTHSGDGRVVPMTAPADTKHVYRP